MSELEGKPAGWEFPDNDLNALDAYFGLRTIWRRVHEGVSEDVPGALADYIDRYLLTADEAERISDVAYREVFGIEPRNPAEGWGLGTEVNKDTDDGV